LLIFIAAISCAAEENPYSYERPPFIMGNTEERIRELEEKLEKGPYTLYQKEIFERELILAKSLGQAVLDKAGNIIPIARNPPQEVKELQIVPSEDQGYELTYMPEDGKEKIIYALVHANGEIEYMDNNKPDTAVGSRPGFWSYTDEVGSLAVPPPGIAIGRAIQERSEKEVLPYGYEGWLYQLPGGFFLSGPADTIPPDNVISVMRTANGGLELFHNGPQEKGLFARIEPDCSVSFHQGVTGENQEGKSYWTLKNEKGLPAVGNVLIHTLTEPQPPVEYVTSFGTAIPGWEIE
jgi:hypothetical protein